MSSSTELDKVVTDFVVINQGKIIGYIPNTKIVRQG